MKIIRKLNSDTKPLGVLKFHTSRDGDPMVSSEDLSYGGMFNNAGTVVLSFTNTNKVREFTSNLDKLGIKFGYFFGNKEIIVINNAMDYFDIQGVPANHLTNSRGNNSFGQYGGSDIQDRIDEERKSNPDSWKIINTKSGVTYFKGTKSEVDKKLDSLDESYVAMPSSANSRKSNSDTEVSTYYVAKKVRLNSKVN